MEFLKNIGKAVGNAVSFVGEKNRRSANLNRIRTVIRCEEKAAEREYLALGRYYYNNLRDDKNPITESHCAQLDEIEGRLDKALTQLEQFYQQEQNDGLSITIDIVKDQAAQSTSSSVGVISGEDGPTAVYTNQGGVELEEVTLDGVKEFDHEPTPAEVAEKPSDASEAKTETTAEVAVSEDLPFEG